MLIKQYETSGSVEVKFASITLKEKTLICPVSRSNPVIRTLDIAVYCSAIVVPKERITHVQIVVDNRAFTMLEMP